MTRSETIRLEAFIRGEKFGEKYGPAFPETGPARALFTELSTVVSALQTDAAVRVGNTREGRAATRAARTTLKQRVDPIARMAKVIARTNPGFDAPFVRPRQRRQEELLTTARAYLTAVEPQSAVFIAHGMPSDFVGALRAAVTALEDAAGTRDSGKLARASAKAGVGKAIKEGRAVLSKIDVLVRYHFANDEEVMAAWIRASKLEGVPTPKAEKGTATTSPPGSSANTASNSTSDTTQPAGASSTVVKPAA